MMNGDSVLWRSDIRAVFVSVIGLAREGGLMTAEAGAVVAALAGALDIGALPPIGAGQWREVGPAQLEDARGNGKP